MSRYKNLAAIGLATMLSFGLVACGGGGGDTPPPPPVEEPTAYEKARDAIQAAGTAAEAQAAYDAAKDDVTAAEGQMLQDAVDARVAALAKMDRADAQKMALMTAAGNIDTSDLMTAEAVAAANTAIAALKAALAAATDVSDADKAMYQGRVTAAETAVAAAQSALDHDAQMMALSEAVSALQDIDLSDLLDQAEIDAANAAIAALRTALDNATELSDAEKTAAMTELATASRTVMAAQGSFDTESQMTMLADAVGALKMVDLDNLMTQVQIDAADEAIIALDLALGAATNLTDGQKLDALTDVTLAKRKVTAAKTTLAENVGSQTMALTDAGTALAAIDLADLDTAEKIAAANEAVEALKMALANATHLSDVAKAMYQSQLDTATETVRMAQTGMDHDGRMMAQRTAITDALTKARTAVGMVNDNATDAQVSAADEAVSMLKAAIEDAEDLPEGDTEVAEAQGALETLEGLLTSAKTSRMAAMDKAEKDRNTAMMATAMKLYTGIGSAPLASTGDGARTVAIDTEGVVSVTIGADPAAVPLSEDKKTTVAPNYNWEGKHQTAEPEGNVGMYEARVYSNVGDPIEGDPFNEEYSPDGTTGEVAIDTTDAAVAGRVSSPRFDQSAGMKPFDLPSNTVRVMLPGSYHGVSGNYYCTPTDATTKCTSTVAASGFTLTGGAWTFKPTSATTKVTEVADMDYVSYGWWLHKSEDGMTYTVSAFANERGDVPAATNIDTLRGTATYMGGAAGKYSLYSSTGGTNDAGHFTAKATLDADFNTDMISGTIDNFMGADGMTRDWSVELKKSGVSAGGVITGSDGTGDPMETVWTIGDTPATAAGQWSGLLQNNGDDDGVPMVASGTFNSEYSTAGRMVGAFGATKE